MDRLRWRFLQDNTHIGGNNHAPTSTMITINFTTAMACCLFLNMQAVTRAKERLIMTRPRWRYLPAGLVDASPDELFEQLQEGGLWGHLQKEEISASSFLSELAGFGEEVLVMKNLSKMPAPGRL
jgi:hypothetical protein